MARAAGAGAPRRGARVGAVRAPPGPRRGGAGGAVAAGVKTRGLRCSGRKRRFLRAGEIPPERDERREVSHLAVKDSKTGTKGEISLPLSLPLLSLLQEIHLLFSSQLF